jgi:DNA-binding CsgD family transcriptional regulator
MGGAAALAGRVAELQAVSELLSGETEHAAVLIIGEAGVGKSRLVAAAADAATFGGAVVATGSCLPLSEGVPFLPVVDVLGELEKADEGRLLTAALAECAPFVRGELGRLLPDLAESTDELAPNGSEEAWRKQRLFEALRRVFAALARQRALGLVVEDVHWADASTVELLDYLLAPGHAPDVPVALTCRSEEPLTPALADWTDRLQRNPRLKRLDLAPMSETETAEQIEMLIGAPPPRGLALDIYARSEGNAFFTEQLVAAAASGEDHLLPAGLTSLLLSRTRHMTGVGREILAGLALAAQRLDEATIALLCQRPTQDVRAALRDLLDRRLLRRPDAAGRYQLRHALLGEAISSELLPSERAELHARIADALADSNDPTLVAQIAEHLAAAGRPIDELRWRIIAGRRADSVFAPAEAAPHWQRAIALSSGARITQMVEGMSLAELYVAAEDALLLAGSFDAAQALAEQSLERFAGGEPGSRATVLARAGTIFSLVAPQRALDLLYQALAIYERLPPSPHYVNALRSLSGILEAEGRKAEALDVIERAAAVAERAGERSAYLQILGAQAWEQMVHGAPALAADRMVAVRQGLTNRDEPRIHVWLALTHTDILLKLGRLTEVEAAGAPALERAKAYGIEQSPWTGTLRGNVCEALIELGAIETATEWIDPLSKGKPDPSSRSNYQFRATLEMLRGNLDAAQRRWAELRQLPQEGLGFQVEDDPPEVELHLWRGSPEAAYGQSYALLGRVVQANYGALEGQLLTFAGPLLVLGLRACADAAEQARTGRDDTAVHAAQQRANQLTEFHRGMRPDPFTAGPLRPTAVADHAIWQAEWSRLRGEPDPALWEQAATAWDVLTRPHRAAYARWRQAEALLAHPGGRSAAVEVLQTAARQAAQHVPLSEAINDLARRARIDLNPFRPADRPERPAPTAFGLTDRELAVLELLGQGKTNSEIGAALFISRKTASVHVTSILRKLGVQSRVQAAAVAERAGLLPGR